MRKSLRSQALPPPDDQEQRDQRLVNLLLDNAIKLPPEQDGGSVGERKTALGSLTAVFWLVVVAPLLLLSYSFVKKHEDDFYN